MRTCMSYSIRLSWEPARWFISSWIWKFLHGCRDLDEYLFSLDLNFQEITFRSKSILVVCWGIQFSTDHWNDPFLSSVCALIFMCASLCFHMHALMILCPLPIPPNTLFGVSCRDNTDGNPKWAVSISVPEKTSSFAGGYPESNGAPGFPHLKLSLWQAHKCLTHSHLWGKMLQMPTASKNGEETLDHIALPDRLFVVAFMPARTVSNWNCCCIFQ